MRSGRYNDMTGTDTINTLTVAKNIKIVRCTENRLPQPDINTCTAKHESNSFGHFQHNVATAFNCFSKIDSPRLKLETEGCRFITEIEYLRAPQKGFCWNTTPVDAHSAQCCFFDYADLHPCFGGPKCSFIASWA